MNQETQKKDQLFLFGMILSMFCWGMSWTSGKILSEYGSALSVSFYRFALTFFSLFILLVVFRQKLKIKLEGWKDLLPASVGIAVYTYLFFKGLSSGLPGAGGVLVTTLNPIVSYSLMLLLAFRRPTRNETLGLIIGLIAGVILLKLWSNWQHVFSAGNTYLLLASFSWSVLSIFTAKSAKYGTPFAFSLWMYCICSLLLFFIVGVSENMEVYRNADNYFWGNLIFSSTITTALATTFYFVATTKLGASKASSFIFLVPVSAAFGSWLFLDEVPQWHTIVGGVIGVSAVYILNKKEEV